MLNIPAPSQFRKKPVVVSASQWFMNGDHPLDYSKTHDGLENGELRQFSPEERRANGWEGDIVRYYRHPDDSGERACQLCGNTMHMHGWIDTKEGGHIVCPGDWIITGVQGEHYPCKPDIFAATYESANAPAPSAPGDAQDEDDSIALDKLADYIADTWPDKKYGLEEICQRLHAMWPGEFLSAADLEKNDPNVREALRALLLWWDRFQASDGDPKDACELLVKDARFAWQFAEAEINRAPATAPAAGDALDAKRYRWLRDQTETDGIAIVMKNKHFDGSRTCAENIDEFIDAALAAQVPQQGEA